MNALRKIIRLGWSGIEPNGKLLKAAEKELDDLDGRLFAAKKAVQNLRQLADELEETEPGQAEIARGAAKRIEDETNSPRT